MKQKNIKKAGFCIDGPFFETNEHFLGQKRAFQANMTNVEQKCLIANLFRL
jgi:hypothetical protein